MIDDRLTELEIRYTLQQELLQQLSDVVAEQARTIEALRRDLDRLRARIDEEGNPLDPDERPPHY